MHRTLTITSAAAFLTSAAHAQTTFRGLGDLSGGSFNSEAFTVSEVLVPGFTIVGDATSATGDEAFRSSNGSMVGLGFLPGGNTSSARDLGGNGQFIVGYGNSATAPMEAMRWTPNTGMVSLNFGTDESQALSVSFDGSIIVGYRGVGAARRPIRWTAETGPVELGDLPGGTSEGVAYGVEPHQCDWPYSSANLLIVGYSSSATGYQAFRWTPASGMVALPMPPNGVTSAAYSVTYCGAVLGTVNNLACYWQNSTSTPIIIGTLPGAPEARSIARAAAGVVLGESSSSGTSLGTEAFIFDFAVGCRSLKSVLAAGGAQVAGWDLISARGVGRAINGGTVIVGWGINPKGNPEAWLATLEPACYANCDGTDAPQLTGNDFVCFIGRFNTGSLWANCDGSTGIPLLTGNDFLCYMSAYAAGCS